MRHGSRSTSWNGGDSLGTSFITCHDQCLDDWNKAVRSGEMGSLSKYPSSDYQGFFGYKDASNVTPTSRDEAIRGHLILLNNEDQLRE